MIVLVLFLKNKNKQVPRVMRHSPFQRRRYQTSRTLVKAHFNTLVSNAGTDESGGRGHPLSRAMNCG